MRIEKIEIFGFGKWENQSFALPQSPLVTFFGHNEAGKTSIRVFITYILFGLSKKERDRYQPNGRALFGGKLTVIVEQESISIERSVQTDHKAVLKRETNQGDEVINLSDILNIDQELFDRIFNFDVFNLKDDTRVNPSEIGDLILSVVMSGSDHIYQAEKQLKKERDQYFLKKGSKPILNQKADQLIETDKKMKAIRSEYENYAISKEELEEKLIALETLKTQKQESDESLRKMKDLLRYFEELTTYHLVKQEMKALSDAPFISDDKKEAFIRHSESLGRLKESMEKLMKEQDETAFKIEKEKNRLLKDDEYERVNNLLADEAELSDFLQQKKYSTEQLGKLLAQTSWGPYQKSIIAEIATTDLSLNKKPVYQALSEKRKELEPQIKQYKTDVEYNRKKQEKLVSEKEKAEKHLLSKVETDLLSKRLDKINEHLMEKIADQKSSIMIGARLINLGIAVSFLSIMLILLTAFDFNEIIPLIVLTVVVFVMVLISIMSIRKRENLSGKTNAVEGDQKPSLMEEQGEIVEKLGQHEQGELEINSINIRLEQIDQTLERDEERLNRLTEELAEVNETLDNEILKYPFLKDKEVEQWLDLLAFVDKYREAKEETKRLEIVKSDASTFISEYLVQMQAFFPNMTEKMIKDGVAKLYELKTNHDHALTQINAYKKELTIIEREIVRKTEEREQHEEQKEQLFASIPVQDESIFIKRVEDEQQWLAYESEQKQREKKLALHFDERELKTLLESFNLKDYEIRDQINIREQSLKGQNEELDALGEEIAELKAKLNQMERAHDLIDLKHAFYQQRDVFNIEAKAWLKYAIAYDRLMTTKEQFQTAYVPAILKRSSHILQTMTSNRFSAVNFDQSNGQIFLKMNDEVIYLEQLSQGTIDQLLTSIRLALALHLKEKVNIDLPFLIDDGFVHFDRERKHNLLSLLANESKVQVIYFTKEEIDEGLNVHQIKLQTS